MSDLLFRMVARWAVTTRTSGNELPGQRENFGIFPDERSAKQALADAGFTNTEFGWRLVGGYTSANIEKQVAYEQTEAAAEIARLTEALADGSFYKESDIDALQDKIASLTEALAASEEARRAERAAVVRECAHTAYVACAETRHGILGDRCHAAICRLATDADNAALDKLLREARMEGMERAALAVTERADQENEFAAMHGELENNSKAREAARVVTTLRGVAAHIRILAALEAPPPPTAIAEDA